MMQALEEQAAKPKVHGYRDLTADEIGLMNDIKVSGENLRKVVEFLRGCPDLDQRWVSIGETHLQQGIMALVRAVAKPTTF